MQHDDVHSLRAQRQSNQSALYGTRKTSKSKFKTEIDNFFWNNICHLTKNNHRKRDWRKHTIKESDKWKKMR